MTEIKIVDNDEQPTAVLHERVAMSGLPEFFDRAYSAVAAAMGEQGVGLAGPPFALYHGIPTDTVDVEAGFPVASVVEVGDEVEPGVLPAGRAAEAVHVGSYDTLSQTYDEVVRWVQEQGMQLGSDMWEYYLTDPSSDPDPASWRTRIVCPVT
jgi:effector-binding domain-containing protein